MVLLKIATFSLTLVFKKPIANQIFQVQYLQLYSAKPLVNRVEENEFVN